MKLKVASIVIVLALVVALGCMAGTSFASPVSSDPDYKVNTVKLEWVIPDIAVTYQIQKSWDADKLQWVESKYVASIEDVSSTFTLTNYSSDSIIGTVDFTVESSLASTLSSVTFNKNGETISAFQEDPASSNTISATLEFEPTEFAELDATDEAVVYGTYTVSIIAAA